MKQYIVAMVAVMASSFAGSSQEHPDTLISVENTSKIIITENPAGVEVKIVSDDGSDSSKVSVVEVEYDSKDSWTSAGTSKNPLYSLFSMDRRQRKIERKDRHSRSHHNSYDDVETDFYGGGFMFGFVNACEAPRGLDIEMGKSFELGIFQLIGMKTSFFGGWSAFSLGMGLDWRNYKLTTSSTRFIPVDREVTFGPYPEGTQPRFSRLKVFSLTFPIMWEQRFPFKVPGGDRFSISFGISLNYNGHSSLKSKWIDSSFNEVEEYCGHIGRRPFTFDYVGIVRLANWLGIYAKYSPKTVLRGNINPSFKSFSTGLILFY